MKKIFYLGIGLLMLLLGGCGGTSEENDAKGTDGSTDNNLEETYVIRVPLLGSDTNFVNRSYTSFKESIEEKSDGRFEVQIYGSGTLAPSEEQQLELVADGGAELTSLAAAVIPDAVGIEGFGIFDVPFLFTNDERLYKFLDGEAVKEIYADLESKRDLKVLGSYDMSGYNIFNTKRKIESPEDLKGLKIRTAPNELHVSLFKELGANPTPISYGETFTALQQGTIDGSHLASGLIWTDKFYEVTKYLTLTRHYELVHFILINDSFLESLPDDLKEILLGEIDNLIDTAHELGNETNDEALQVMEDAGIEITELSEEQIEAFREATQETLQAAIDRVGEDYYEKVLESLE